jgi:hypothetical protein
MITFTADGSVYYGAIGQAAEDRVMDNYRDADEAELRKLRAELDRLRESERRLREALLEADTLMGNAINAAEKIDIERKRGAGYRHAEVDWLVDQIEEMWAWRGKTRAAFISVSPPRTQEPKAPASKMFYDDNPTWHPPRTEESKDSGAEPCCQEFENCTRRCLPLIHHLRSQLSQAQAALEFYADPETYHAIAYAFDRPCGAFTEDFSEDHGNPFYDRAMPGKTARAALAWVR